MGPRGRGLFLEVNRDVQAASQDPRPPSTLHMNAMHPMADVYSSHMLRRGGGFLFQCLCSFSPNPMKKKIM